MGSQETNFPIQSAFYSCSLDEEKIEWLEKDAEEYFSDRGYEVRDSSDVVSTYGPQRVRSVDGDGNERIFVSFEKRSVALVTVTNLGLDGNLGISLTSFSKKGVIENRDNLEFLSKKFRLESSDNTIEAEKC